MLFIIEGRDDRGCTILSGHGTSTFSFHYALPGQTAIFLLLASPPVGEGEGKLACTVFFQIREKAELGRAFVVTPKGGNADFLRKERLCAND